MPTALDHSPRPPLCRSPWPRFQVDQLLWRRLGDDLAAGRATLLGLWAEADCVHMALLDSSGRSVSMASLATADGQFPSLARRHLPALRPERALCELTGLTAEGCPDVRPWLRHDGAYQFLPAEGAGVHEIGVGPIHAGIIEPGHFRFSVNGETVVRLEQRLGYCHRGVDALLVGADPGKAARLVARLSGDSTVAYGLAFARAIEQALGLTPPPRAQWLRALAAEIERVANHLGDIGFICNDAAMAALQAPFAILREELLQLTGACFGHRLMMDLIQPGGVATDLDSLGQERLRAWLDHTERRFDGLMAIYDDSASLKERTLGTGLLSPALAARFGAGGFIGRASARDFDARRDLPYAPYDQLSFSVTVLNRGDVNARLWLRQCEVRQSFTLIRQILALLPGGALQTRLPPPPAAGSEGAAIVEGFRGDILLWLRLDAEARLLHCHARDPSWFQWPLLEAVIEGNIVADFPLCNKSFNCSYAGHDR